VRGLSFVVAIVAAAACSNEATPLSAPSADAGTDALSIAPLDCSDDGADWPFYGGNVCNTRVTRGSSKITPATAPKLGVKWVANVAGDVSATPAVVAGQVYVPDWGGMMNRIDGATGDIVWSKHVGDLAALPSLTAAAPAGGTMMHRPPTRASSMPSSRGQRPSSRAAW
jgi:hypothetical protein